MPIVTIDSTQYHYTNPWNGEILTTPGFAFDTETRLIQDNCFDPPELALISVSNIQQSFLIHPARLADFIELHPNSHYIFHNISFDFWVVDEYLLTHNHSKAREIWWALVERNLTHDTMLLDMLLNLGIDDTYPRPRDLGIIAKTYAGVKISKDDPYRLRYGELIGRDWNDPTIEEGFWEYAIKDPIADYLAFGTLYNHCKALCHRLGIKKATVEKFGILSEQIQIKGALGLTKTTRNGIKIDRSYSGTLHQKFKDFIAGTLTTLFSTPKYKAIFKFHKKTHELLLTKTGNPSISTKELKVLLLEEYAKYKDQMPPTFEIPLTAKKQVSTAPDEWQDLEKHSYFLQLYSKLKETLTLSSFFNKIDKEVVYPRYTYFVRTGRISAFSPNITNMPKAEGFREIFTARPGYLLLAMDYKFIELRTLAAIFEHLFGYSVLAQVIREGRDPHCFTAAMFTGKTYEEFLELEHKDKPFFKLWRQRAKIVNFGLPGGLSANRLVHYADIVYNIKLTLEQATEYRDKLLNVVYPEMGHYLDEDTNLIVSSNLGCSYNDFIDKFKWSREQDKESLRFITIPIKNVLQGEPFNKNGVAYNQGFVDRIWDNLIYLNQNESIENELRARLPSEDLFRKVFWNSVTTLTGRIRGRTSYTQNRNTGFQGLAADGAKLAVWRLTCEGYRILMLIHDEIVIELKDEGGYILKKDVDNIKKIMCSEMEKLTGHVPIDTDFLVDKKWKKEGKVRIENDRVYPK